MRTFSSFVILCIISIINGSSSDETFWSYDMYGDNVRLSNDGPVTIDTPITFNAVKIPENNDHSYEYRFKFEQFPQLDKAIVSTSYLVTYSVTFESSPTLKPGNYTVQVDVSSCRLGVPTFLIGAAQSTFQLSDSLIGHIDVDQDVWRASSNKNFVSTAKPVNLTAKVYGHGGAFDSANMTYKWIVNGLPQEEVDKSIQPTFSKAQLNNITVIVTATKTNGTRLLQKSGSFNITLESKDPITGLTVDGPTEVKLFERLQLDLKIHGGTPPFQYASRFSLDTTKMSMNLWSNGLEGYEYCSKARKYSNDSFHSIIKYFGQRGTRESTISVANDVSVFTKTMNILVY